MTNLIVGIIALGLIVYLIFTIIRPGEILIADHL